MNWKLLLKKYYGWLIFLLVSAGLAYANLAMYMTISPFEMRHVQSGRMETVTLPLSRMSEAEGAVYELRGTIDFGRTASTLLHITPDDWVTAMTINDQTVNLSVAYQDDHTWENGFDLDVGPYVHPGVNSITIQLTDFGGDLALKIKPRLGGGWQLRLVFAVWVVLGIFWLSCRDAILKAPKLHMALYCLVICGALLRIWTIYTYNPVDHIFSDSQRHWEQGKDVLRNDLMSNTDPIMYQLYIGALLKLTLNMPPLVAFYTCVLSLLGPWLWYRFLRELQDSKTLALAGWAAISLLPSWISIYTYFMQETLLIPLLGAALWATWRARRKGTLSSFAWMVTLWIVAGLTRGIMIPLAAVSCTALWLTQDQKLKKALISSCILLFALGPLTYRSYQTVGHFAPHGMGHLAAIYAMSGKQEIILNVKKGGYAGYGFGSPSMEDPIFRPLSNWTSRRRGQIHLNIDLDKGFEDWGREFAKVKQTWRHDMWWIAGENVLLLMFGPSWPDNNADRLLDRINILMRWIWAPALLTALVWVIALRRRLKRQWLLPSLILTWFIFQAILPLIVNEGRYRKPFEGLIIAQMVLLAAVARSKVREGLPYQWGIDFSRWLPAKMPAPGNEAVLPAAESSMNEAAADGGRNSRDGI